MDEVTICSLFSIAFFIFAGSVIIPAAIPGAVLAGIFCADSMSSPGCKAGLVCASFPIIPLFIALLSPLWTRSRNDEIRSNNAIPQKTLDALSRRQDTDLVPEKIFREHGALCDSCGSGNFEEAES